MTITKSVRRAIWTMPQEDADRLVQLSQEHSKLVKDVMGAYVTLNEKKAMYDRIAEIRRQRDNIIRQYQK